MTPYLSPQWCKQHLKCIHITRATLYASNSHSWRNWNVRLFFIWHHPSIYLSFPSVTPTKAQVLKTFTGLCTKRWFSYVSLNQWYFCKKEKTEQKETIKKKKKKLYFTFYTLWIVALNWESTSEPRRKEKVKNTKYNNYNNII